MFFGYCNTKTTDEQSDFQITYCDVHFNFIWDEVYCDWLYRHWGEGDTPWEEEKEDQTANKETQAHGDADMQLPETGICKITF